MTIGTNFLVMVNNYQNQVQDPYYFISVEAAREYANNQWKAGARRVSLYKRNAHGWDHVQTVHQTYEQAEAKWELHLQELARLAGATIVKN